MCVYACISGNRLIDPSSKLQFVQCTFGGALSIMIIIMENGHCDLSSNAGLGCLHFI